MPSGKRTANDENVSDAHDSSSGSSHEHARRRRKTADSAQPSPQASPLRNAVAASAAAAVPVAPGRPVRHVLGLTDANTLQNPADFVATHRLPMPQIGIPGGARANLFNRWRTQSENKPEIELSCTEDNDADDEDDEGDEGELRAELGRIDRTRSQSRVVPGALLTRWKTVASLVRSAAPVPPNVDAVLDAPDLQKTGDSSPLSTAMTVDTNQLIDSMVMDIDALSLNQMRGAVQNLRNFEISSTQRNDRLRMLSWLDFGGASKPKTHQDQMETDKTQGTPFKTPLNK